MHAHYLICVLKLCYSIIIRVRAIFYYNKRFLHLTVHSQLNLHSLAFTCIHLHSLALLVTKGSMKFSMTDCCFNISLILKITRICKIKKSLRANVQLLLYSMMVELMIQGRLALILVNTVGIHAHIQTQARNIIPKLSSLCLWCNALTVELTQYSLVIFKGGSA